jgi:hypothetical protein
MLPVLNGSFLIDPDPWKVKFLVLRFKNSVTINVREKHVIDFVVVENMLRRKEGKERHSNIASFDDWEDELYWYLFIFSILITFGILLYVSFKFVSFCITQIWLYYLVHVMHFSKELQVELLSIG